MKTNISVSIPVDLAVKIIEEAKKLNIPVSHLIVNCIKKQLK